MKKIALLTLFLVACTTAEASMPTTAEPVTAEPAPLTIERVSASAALLAPGTSTPLANATHTLPAAVGQPAGCRYESVGYVCPNGTDVTLAAGGWAFVKTEGVVLFPIVLSAGETLDLIRAKVDCPAGDTMKVTLKIDDPENRWEQTLGPALATCGIAGEDVDLDVSSYMLPSSGFRMMTVAVTSSSAGAHTFGLELATH